MAKKRPAPPKRTPIENFRPSDRGAWRDWLRKNHALSSGVWVFVQKKNSRCAGVNLNEAVEEAVSFGWVDSKLNVVDKDQFKLLMTPRKEGSIWSKSNKIRVEKLTREGLMMESGLQAVEEAKRDGSWNKLADIENLKLPEDLVKALSGSEVAESNFTAFPDSYKKQVLWWIANAKRRDTRARRIALTVTSAELKRRIFSA